MNMIKLSVLKNRLSGILSVGNPNISVVSGIKSVVGIPPVPIPIPEEITVAHVWLQSYKTNNDSYNKKRLDN